MKLAPIVAFVLVMYSSAILGQDLKPYANIPLGTLWSSYDEVPASGKTRREYAPIDEMMVKFLVDNQLPGATLAISKGSRLVYARGFGYSDIENELPMPANAQMRLASISKPITAAAIMKLVDQGELTLETKVFDRFDFAAKGPIKDTRLLDITVLQLLRHTAGFDRNVSYDPMFIEREVARAVGRKTPVEPDDIIKFMLGQKLDFAPGTKYAYSNYGYSVLGRVIEKVSGKGYEEYVQEEVLRPLGLRNMRVGYTLPEKKFELEPRYYMRDGGTVSSLFDPSAKVPHPYGRWSVQTMDAHGGWVASAIEMVKFASAFDKPKRCPILSKKAVEAIFFPPDLDLRQIEPGRGGTKRFYGCGWNMLVFGENKFNAYHGGLFSGTSNILVRRRDGFNWAVLFNCNQTPNKKKPSSAIDSLVHRAVDSVGRFKPISPR